MFKTVVLLLSAILFVSCNKNQNQAEVNFMDFIKSYEEKVKPLSRDASSAYYDASISGKKEDYKKYNELNIKLEKIYTNKQDFKKLDDLLKSGDVEDELLKRQLEILHSSYLSNQIDEKLLEETITLQTKVEEKYSTYRTVVDGKKLTDNQIEDILKTSKDSKKLQTVWMESKKIGKEVQKDVLKLVDLRNKAAVSLGFGNYQEMSLKLSEQDPEELEQLLDELDELTAPAFAKLKEEMDEVLAKQYGIDKEKLMPWHYQNRYFQEAPKIYKVDFDKYFKNVDIAETARKYYDGIGLNVDDILKNSDLYEKPGKYQHAYCTNIDREGDVRILCNITKNQRWMETVLHELGHAVYDKYIDHDLPWTLRTHAHIFTTEAIAMMFGRQASNPVWIKDMVGIPDAEVSRIKDDSFKMLRLAQLVFSRWVQVIYRFEKEMYSNPKQDLNKLWWDLVEKYQLIKKPEGRNEPDWGSKIHVAIVPVYYHNYLLGELLASQLNNYIVTNVLKCGDLNSNSYKDSKKAGEFLRTKVFGPGRRYKWNGMIERATGEKLTAKYYAKQFVE